MRMKLIARIMAEGVRDIFSLLHGTIRKHGQEAADRSASQQMGSGRSAELENPQRHDDQCRAGTGGKAQQFAQMMALRTSRRNCCRRQGQSG
jgi:hypothetical protein